jgi:SAM-dependent methyltransferase
VKSSVSDVVGYRLASQERRAAGLTESVQRLLAPFHGTERAIDSGCGAGALAFALAPFVEHVVGVDLSAELVAAGNELAPPNCELVVGDSTALPFEYGSFDIAGCMRVLHHARRPELVVSELARVTRPGGLILLVDQLGFVDPVVSAEMDRFEQARDPSHTRLLPDQDIRSLLDANDLDVLTNEIASEQRDLERYLDLVGLEGNDRRRVRGMAPGAVYEVDVGWYVARKRGGLS